MLVNTAPGVYSQEGVWGVWANIYFLVVTKDNLCLCVKKDILSIKVYENGLLLITCQLLSKLHAVLTGTLPTCLLFTRGDDSPF